MERRRFLEYGLGALVLTALGCPSETPRNNSKDYLSNQQARLVQRAPATRSPMPAAQLQPQTTEPNYRTNDFSTDSDEVLLARMIFGEARGESYQGRIAVAYSAVNRLQNPGRFGGNLRQVLLRRAQYSCFNLGDPNRTRLMNPMRYDASNFRECLGVARNVLGRRVADPTNGANHYFNPNTANPSWANRMTRTARIGNHDFYRN